MASLCVCRPVFAPLNAPRGGPFPRTLSAYFGVNTLDGKVNLRQGIRE